MADRKTPMKDGELVALKVKASTKIEAGKMVAVDATGYALEAADTSGLIVMGRAENVADNSSGSDGDISVNVRRKKSFKYKNSLTTAVDIASVGSNVVVEDDQTVTTAAGATNDIVAGKCLGVESDGVWVYIA